MTALVSRSFAARKPATRQTKEKRPRIRKNEGRKERRKEEEAKKMIVTERHKENLVAPFEVYGMSKFDVSQSVAASAWREPS
jgi:hypothetical protein